ncbi:TPA: DUF3592 domain-containing protein [Streptococcus pyogenes]
MNEIKFIRIMGAIFLLIGILYYVYPKVKLKNAVNCKGTIVKTETAIPSTYKKNNSKYGYIEICVLGKKYLSEKIQIPFECDVGQVIDVQYNKNNPNIIFIKDRARNNLFFLLIGTILIVYSIVNKH